MRTEDLQGGVVEKASPDARAGRLMITGSRLGEIWPDVRPRLIRRLVSKGLDRDTAEDITQEVALRALATSLEYSDVDDFLRWAFTVARNLHVDQTRQRARVLTVVDMPERSDGCDVAVQVERRMTLQRAWALIAEMKESDQSAIVEGIFGSDLASRRVAVRVAVRRHRLRTRMKELLGEGVVAGLVPLWLRRFGKPLIAVPTAAASVLALSAPVVGAIPPGLRPGHDHVVTAASPDRALADVFRPSWDAMAAGSQPAAMVLAGKSGEFGRTVIDPPGPTHGRHDVTVKAGESSVQGGVEDRRPEYLCEIEIGGLPFGGPVCVDTASLHNDPDGMAGATSAVPSPQHRR